MFKHSASPIPVSNSVLPTSKQTSNELGAKNKNEIRVSSHSFECLPDLSIQLNYTFELCWDWHCQLKWMCLHYNFIFVFRVENVTNIYVRKVKRVCPICPMFVLLVGISVWNDGDDTHVTPILSVYCLLILMAIIILHAMELGMPFDVDEASKMWIIHTRYG